MLNVLTPEEVIKLIDDEFCPIEESELVGLDESVGRILSIDVIAKEYVPDFNRSTVDGYALLASDTFGCTESIPAVLRLQGEVLMGHDADFKLEKESCVYVPTGGAIPEGADCMVMLEYVEKYGDGTVGIMKSGAPGNNVIFRGDDVFPGKVILEKGREISPSDVGAMAAIGMVKVPVEKKVRVGIISTGDELVPPDTVPQKGQIRDVNTPALSALFGNYGCDVKSFGIVVDDRALLKAKVEEALSCCDVVVLSGGSSVGIKDATYEIIESLGTMLMHGIAVKPGKPTIMGKSGNKPIIGLPGHPAAAFFVAKTFALPLIDRLSGARKELYAVKAVLSENIDANHGRSQYNAVTLKDGKAFPIKSKSGLITQLAGCDGYVCIPRDCEGLGKGTEVDIYR